MTTHTWADIATAPKDGQDVILYCAKGKEIIHECQWSERLGIWTNWGDVDLGERNYVPRHEWPVPTHWMRLTPPTTQP